MSNRMRNFFKANLIGSLSSVTLAQAADNCLSGPKGTAPKGSHWYYRIDHATKRNCWYVRAETEKPISSQNSSLTQPSPQAETPLQPSIANARAEASPADIGQSTGAAATPAPSVDAGADKRQSAVASRWLDGPSVDSKNPSAPGPVDSSPADSGADVNSSTPPVAPAPLAVAEVPSRYGVQTLLLAIFGALAVAALMAGMIFRFGGAGRIDRRENRGARRAPWDSIDVGATLRSPRLATEAPTPQNSTARERHEAVIPNEIVQLLSKLSKEAAA
jgi:hypothetical protein